jgi:hypothetical protein
MIDTFLKVNDIVQISNAMAHLIPDVYEKFSYFKALRKDDDTKFYTKKPYNLLVTEITLLAVENGERLYNHVLTPDPCFSISSKNEVDYFFEMDSYPTSPFTIVLTSSATLPLSKNTSPIFIKQKPIFPTDSIIYLTEEAKQYPHKKYANKNIVNTIKKLQSTTGDETKNPLQVSATTQYEEGWLHLIKRLTPTMELISEYVMIGASRVHWDLTDNNEFISTTLFTDVIPQIQSKLDVDANMATRMYLPKIGPTQVNLLNKEKHKTMSTRSPEKAKPGRAPFNRTSNFKQTPTRQLRKKP